MLNRLMEPKNDFHYMSPFLTCQECYTLNIANPNLLQNTIENVPVQGRSFQPEQIPKCTNCHRTINLSLGVSRATGSTENGLVHAHSKATRVKQQSMEVTVNKKGIVIGTRVESTIKIQRIYRGFLGRLVADKRRIEKEKQDQVEFVSAVKIQSRIRGWVGRQWIKVNSALRCIQEAHPMLLKLALQNNGIFNNKKKVTWYDSEALRVIYSNYRVYVARTGYNPPLQIVENNILEVAMRTIKLQERYATVIQSHWRAMPCRVFWRHYKTQRAVQKEKHSIAALILERSIRKHLVFKKFCSMKSKHATDKIYHNYINERMEMQAALEIEKQNSRLKRIYTNQREQERTLRYLSKIPCNTPFLKRITQYECSAYGSDELRIGLTKFQKAKLELRKRQERARGKSSMLHPLQKNKVLTSIHHARTFQLVAREII